MFILFAVNPKLTSKNVKQQYLAIKTLCNDYIKAPNGIDIMRKQSQILSFTIMRKK